MSMLGKLNNWRAARKVARQDRRNKAIWEGLSRQVSDDDRAQSAREAKQRQIADEQAGRTIMGQNF